MIYFQGVAVGVIVSFLALILVLVFITIRVRNSRRKKVGVVYEFQKLVFFCSNFDRYVFLVRGSYLRFVLFLENQSHLIIQRLTRNLQRTSRHWMKRVSYQPMTVQTIQNGRIVTTERDKCTTEREMYRLVDFLIFTILQALRRNYNFDTASMITDNYVACIQHLIDVSADCLRIVVTVETNFVGKMGDIRIIRLYSEAQELFAINFFYFFCFFFVLFLSVY